MTDRRPVLFDVEQLDRPVVVDDRPDDVLDHVLDVDLDDAADAAPDDGFDDRFEPVVHDPRLVETRAMDILEIAVEVTASPDPEVVLPEPSPDPADGSPAAGAAADSDASTLADGEVDPRIEERRLQVAAERRRTRWRRLVGVIAGLAALGGAYVAVQSSALDVDHIEIVGSELLTRADVARLADVRIGDPMVFVAPDDVRADLAGDPRFVRVVVQRRFPSTISVRVTDRRAIAVVDGPTRGVVVGEDGVIIAVARGDELMRHVQVSEDPPKRPGRRLSAPIAAAVDVMGSMSFEIAVQIVGMRITPEGELIFDLGEGRTVLFGTVEDAERKLLATRTMLGPQVDTSELCQLDVRVPTAPTIRRDPDCDPPPPPPVVDPAATDPAAVDPNAAPPAATDPAATATTAPPATTPPDTAPPTTFAPLALSPSDPGADPGGVLAPEPNAPVTVPAG